MGPDKNHSGSSRKSGSRSTTRINSAATTTSTTLTTTTNHSVFGGFETLLKRKSFLANALIGLGQDSKHYLLQEIVDHPTGVNCLALSEDRSLLVSGGEDSVVRLWSTFSNPCECIGVLCGHKDYITCCCVHQYLVISGSADCTLRLWSIETGYCLMILTGHQAFVSRCCTYGAILLSTSFDNTVRVWALTEQLTVIQSIRQDSFEHDDHETMEQFSDQDHDHHDDDDDDYLADCESNTTRSYRDRMEKFRRQNGGTVLVNKRTVPVRFGQCLWILDGHKKSVTQSAIVNQDDSSKLKQGIIQELDLIVTTSIDGKALIYSLATGQLRHVLKGHCGPINCLAIDGKESRFIYTAGGDSVIKHWNVITGEFIKNLSGHEASILCLLSHNRILYSGSMDRTVRAWAMEFGQCTRVYYQSTAPVSCLQYFRGILYTGCNDYCARLYDSNSAVLKKTFSGHRSPISALQVIPGKLFTSSFDGRILVWDCQHIQADKTDLIKLRAEDVGQNVSQALVMKMMDRQTLNRSISSVSSSLNRQTNRWSMAATTNCNQKHPRRKNPTHGHHGKQESQQKSRSSSSRRLMEEEEKKISNQLSYLFHQQQQQPPTPTPTSTHPQPHRPIANKSYARSYMFDSHKSYDDDDGCLAFLSYYCCWYDWIKMFSAWRCCCACWWCCCCDCTCLRCCTGSSTQRTTPSSRKIPKYPQPFAASRSTLPPTMVVYGDDQHNHHQHQQHQHQHQHHHQLETEHQQQPEELDSENVRHAIEALEPYIRSFK